MAKIKFKRSSVAGRKPTGLESGEIGINLTDRKIYVGNDSGAIVQLGNDPIIEDRLEAKKGATISGGTVTISGNQTNTGTLTVSGDITSTTGKVKSATLDTGAITATSVAVSGNQTTTGTLTVTGKTTLGETKTGALESTTLNATGVATVASLQSPGSISAGGNAVVTGKVTSGSLDTGAIVATGDVKGATVTTTGKMKSGSVETGAITGSSLVATGNVKAATVTSTGKLTAGSLETAAITASTVTTTGDITTATKVKAASIELANYDNFDAKYIKVGTAITNAVKLQTPRKIAGVNFDGSADIAIPAANVGALPAAGGAMTGALTSNSNITSTKIIEARELVAGYRGSVQRADGVNSPYFRIIKTDIISQATLPTANQSLGHIAFQEGSQTTDPYGGQVRGQLSSTVLTTGGAILYLDARASTGTVTNRLTMNSDTGETAIATGTFKAGTTTLGTTTTGALTASSATINGSATVTGSLSMNSPNAGIELGSLSTAGTPFIDFHTSGTNVDYNIRLIANNSSLSIATPGTTLTDFNMKTTQNIRMHQTAAAGIYMSRDCLILRDHYNGNTSLSASKKTDDDAVGGDIYLGFTNANMKAYTNTVRLEAPMTWKGTGQLVNSAGKLVGASLDTAYLPLTGGTLTNNITIRKNGVGALTFKNTAVDTTVALPTTTQYTGLVNFYEDRAGVEKIRSRLESQILTNGHTYTSLYVRDGADVTKANIRLESETGLVNITTGGLRVGGSSTLVGATTVSGALTASNNLTVAGITTLNGATNAKALTATGITCSGGITASTGSLYTNGDGNSHVWFNTSAGVEKAVIFAGADKVFSIRSNGRSFYFGEGGTGMIRIGEGAYGEEKALIRGVVDGGGHVDWRKRSSGVQIDCPNANTSAYNVWKATKWGRAHIAAMDVHMQGDIESNALVRLLVGNQAFLFNGGGNMSCASITSSGAVYANGGSTFLENNGNVWGSVWEGGHLYNHIEARIRAHMGTRLIANIDDAPAIQTFKAPAPVVDDETNFRYLSNQIDALKDKIEFGTATDEDEQRLLELRKQRSELI